MSYYDNGYQGYSSYPSDAPGTYEASPWPYGNHGAAPETHGVSPWPFENSAETTSGSTPAYQQAYPPSFPTWDARWNAELDQQPRFNAPQSAYPEEPLLDTSYTPAAFLIDPRLLPEQEHEEAYLPAARREDSISVLGSPVEKLSRSRRRKQSFATPPTPTPSRRQPKTKTHIFRSEMFPVPLSQMATTKKVETIDIEKYVNRTIEERHEAVENAVKIKRPINAFLLYRMKYYAVARLNEKSNQIISILMADSWRRETKEVRASFYQLAKIEKNNHAKAFPDWKYLGEQKRKKAEEQEQEQEPDTDDEWDQRWPYEPVQRSRRQFRGVESLYEGPYLRSQNRFRTGF
ncbi:hypothetical protein GGR57DRAFT_514164 [Xylariaceae sp. FL1272]|nr:hypothetical protein GGR57DRAFT_514164 [Xylariaceae sp. FL1272]